MHLLYLDDSGSTKNANEDYFVLGGISVPEQSVRWLSHKIESLAETIVPQNPSSVEFHAAEIFRGTTFPWNGYSSKEQRINQIKKILQIFEDANSQIVIFSCAIHKQSYPNEDPAIKAYEEITSRFDLYLRRISNEQNTQRGIIILDKCSYETSLVNLASQIRREGNKWGSYTRNICEIPLFVDSKVSRIVQLADHVAYAVFRRYNAGDLNYFNVIESRFDQRDGDICGLIHKQTCNKFCTCPACITKRDR